MQLLDLTLHNFKVHRDLRLELPAGVTGIVGKNGKGKSSIIAAIDFLFTGTTDTDQKSDCITLGESEGWVSGNFLLHGKRGYIERHLSVSKVVLRYDGKTLNTATGVKELWAKLLQIDPVIFKNVIIAGQGVIPLLFSGDQSVREKIFQRIFMVPPTEKMRSVIWDKYIKLAPPEQLVEDVSVLEARQCEVAVTANQLNRKIDEQLQHVLSPATLTGVQGRIGFLEKCIRDASQRPALETQLASQVAAKEELDRKIANELQADETRLPELRARHLALWKSGEAYRQFVTLTNQLAAVRTQFTDNDVTEADRLVAETAQKEQQLNEERMTVGLSINAAQKKLEQLGQLVGHAVCPTCEQAVENPLAAIQHINVEKAELDHRYDELGPKLIAAKNAHRAARARRDTLASLQLRATALQTQLDNCQVVAPVEDELQTVAKEIEALESVVRRKLQAGLQSAQLNGTIENLRGKLNNLGHYDSEGTPEEELVLMNEVVATNQHRHDEIAELRLQQGQAVREIQLIDERIATAKKHRGANEQRRKYLDTLQGIYDLFSTSVFPRMLIESYGEYVQKYLQNNLDHFHIPYKARIAPGFKIEMLDAENRPLPTLSGGQNVIVGICLRLALHRMFAQSFPMWLIDEGTTHLDDENRKLYFQLIEQLKKDDIIKQIIIIDHDGQLANVVDRVITIPTECTS